jgi:hypothetical protein
MHFSYEDDLQDPRFAEPGCRDRLLSEGTTPEVGNARTYKLLRVSATPAVKFRRRYYTYANFDYNYLTISQRERLQAQALAGQVQRVGPADGGGRITGEAGHRQDRLASAAGEECYRCGRGCRCLASPWPVLGSGSD